MLSNFEFDPARYRSVPSQEFNVKVTVYRESISGTPNAGPLRTTNFLWTPVAVGWPIAISEKDSNLQFFPQGELEISTHLLSCPFKQNRDLTTVIQTRDILVDEDQVTYLVTYCHDPKRSRKVLIGLLKSGVTEDDLTRQT